ncbi:MAG: hypothetical protein KAW94_04760 [Candidatus Thorarchaeota archaeon]|nr:hypothetical protein [Candidatus Thorarchaeota archaeon]
MSTPLNPEQYVITTYKTSKVVLVLGFTIQELFQISLNAVDASFIDMETKQQMRREFQNDYSKIIDSIE